VPDQEETKEDLETGWAKRLSST